MSKGIAIVNQALEMLKKGDFETFETFLDDNMHFKMMGQTILSGETHNKKEFLSTVSKLMDYLDGPIQLQVREVIDGGDTVVSIAQGKSISKKGEAYNNEYCHVWKVKNNKIVELTEYLDTEMLAQLLCK